MKRGIFFIPIDRPNVDYSKVLEKIKNETVLCDKHGLNEAFFGEHLTDSYEKLSSSLMMVATLSHLTKKIKLGTLTSNVTFYNPGVISCLISTADNLSKGRLMLGVGSGSNPSDVEFVGNEKKNNFDLIPQYLNIINKVLSSKDIINHKTKDLKVKVENSCYKDLKLGYTTGLYKDRKDLEIVMPVLGEKSKNIQFCGKNRFSIVLSNFCSNHLLKKQISFYSENSDLSKQQISDKTKLARFICVCEKEKELSKYLFAEDSPYLFMIKVIYEKLKKFGRESIFGNNSNDLKEIAKKLIICGTPDTVVEKINDLRQEIGNFGTLLYVSTSYNKNKFFSNSLELFANEVKFNKKN